MTALRFGGLAAAAALALFPVSVAAPLLGIDAPEPGKGTVATDMGAASNHIPGTLGMSVSDWTPTDRTPKG